MYKLFCLTVLLIAGCNCAGKVPKRFADAPDILAGMSQDQCLVSDDDREFCYYMRDFEYSGGETMRCVVVMGRDEDNAWEIVYALCQEPEEARSHSL